MLYFLRLPTLNVMFTYNLHAQPAPGHELPDDPFAICGRRCPVYAYHIGPLAVEDWVACNLPWALTVRTR